MVRGGWLLVVLSALGGCSNQADTAAVLSVSAGADQAVAPGSVVTLTAAATPPAGRTVAGFLWTRLEGPAVDLTGANSSSVSFTAPSSSAVFLFRVQARDSRGETATDEVAVTVAAPSSSSGSVVLSGTATYDRVPFNTATNGLDYNTIAPRPIRGATVQLLNSTASSVLLATSTDDNGAYRFAAAPAQTQVVVRVRAELARTGSPSWTVSVQDNTAAGARYVLDSAIFNTGTSDLTMNLRAASGWGGASYTSARAAGPFAILDSVYSAMLKVLAADAFAVFPVLTLNWSPNNRPASGDPATGNIGTSFYNGEGQIFILGDDDTDTDEYDHHVVIHEYGHYFEDAFSRLDSLGGAHGLADRLDPRVAYSEGFANAWSGIVTDDPAYRDSSGSQQASGFQINVESNPVTDALAGWFSENSVQSLIYDLYDGPGSGDSDGDGLALGFAPLYSVLRNQQASSDGLSTVFALVTGLKADRSADAAAISTLAGARGVNGTDDFGAGETNASNVTPSSDVLPVYIQVTVPSSQSVCTTRLSANEEFNKLGNRRLLQFTLSASQTVSITAAGTAGRDPDLALYQRGTRLMLAENDSRATGSQTLNAGSLSAGTYVVEVYDALNTDDDPNTGGRVCFTVSLSN